MSNKLLHLKGSRVKTVKTFPSKAQGNNGDILIAQIRGEGTFLCIKSDGFWHKSSVERVDGSTLRIKDYNKIIEVVNDLTLKASSGIILDLGQLIWHQQVH